MNIKFMKVSTVIVLHVYAYVKHSEKTYKRVNNL